MSKGNLILTEEKFNSIPTLLAEGKTKIEIAELFGCTVNTLQVKCSQRGISLRVNGTPRKARRLPCVAEAVQLASLLTAAKARRTTPVGLVEHMLEIIVKDNLYDAILGVVGEKETV